jgi:hypothetical protein
MLYVPGLERRNGIRRTIRFSGEVELVAQLLSF